MKWTQAPTPEMGEHRICRGFLLSPATLFENNRSVTRITKWLEFASWYEEYFIGGWRAMFWVDEKENKI
jgi:hypothetical protein